MSAGGEGGLMRDVRMRGFHDRAEVAAVVALIAGRVQRLGVEQVGSDGRGQGT